MGKENKPNLFHQKRKFSFNAVIKEIAIYVKHVIRFASTLEINMHF